MTAALEKPAMNVNESASSGPFLPDSACQGPGMARVIWAVASLEIKRNWKVLVGAVAMVFGIKALSSYLFHKPEPGDMAGTGLMIFSLGAIFMATFFSGTSISSEKAGMTLEFLFTRAVPRWWIMVGKIIGSTALYIVFILVSCMAMTPAITAAPSWAPLVYRSLKPLIGTAIAVAALLSSCGFYLSVICSGATATVIFAHVTVFLLCAGIGLFLNPEGFNLAVWIMTITFFLAAIRGMGRGDVIQTRKIFVRSLPALVTGILLSFGAMFALSAYKDASDTPGSHSRVDRVLGRTFAGSVVTNRSSVRNLLSDIGPQSTAILCLDQAAAGKTDTAAPGKGAGKGAGQGAGQGAGLKGPWSIIGCRHWRAISVSPDGETLLAGDFRDIYGLRSQNPRLHLLSSDGMTRDLGIFPMFYDIESCWDGKGRLLLLRANDRRWGMRKNHFFEILRVSGNKTEILGSFTGTNPRVLPMGEGVLIRETGWRKKGWICFKPGSADQTVPEELKDFELEDADEASGTMLVSSAGRHWVVDLATLEKSGLARIDTGASTSISGKRVSSVWTRGNDSGNVSWLRQDGPEKASAGEIELEGHPVGIMSFSRDGRFAAVVTEDKAELDQWDKAMEAAIKNYGGNEMVPNFARGVIHEIALQGLRLTWKLHILDLEEGKEVAVLGPWNINVRSFGLNIAFLEGRRISTTSAGNVEIHEF